MPQAVFVRHEPTDPPAPLPERGNRWQGLTRHPYLVLALCCLFVDACFNVTVQPAFSVDAVLLLCGLAAAALLVYYTVLRPGQAAGGRPVLAAGVAVVVLLMMGQTMHPALWVMLLGLAGAVGLGLALTLNGRLTARRAALLLFALGFALRVGYILYTSVAVRQHDVWFFGGTLGVMRGHASYIEWFADGLRLPDFDPRSVWQFYHPPLHHLLAGCFLRLHLLLGMSAERARESVQVLTLFYSSACMLLIWRLLREIRVGVRAALIPLAMAALHPTFLILSGSINNDILSITLQLAAMLWAVRWYHDPRLRHILAVAVTLGCSMMAKTSGGLVAVGIAWLFLVKLAKGPRRARLIGQFALFGLVCVPLGLWWQVTNLLRWDMPLSYVPLLSQKDAQYVGDLTPLQRLTDWSPRQLQSVYVAFGKTNGAAYYEYNPLLGLLKTAVFGEFSLFAAGSAGYTASVALFWAHLAVVALALACMVLCLLRRGGDRPLQAFFALVWLTVLGSYISFCFQYPHTCTQNFRYAVPTLTVGLAALGVCLQRWQNAGRRGRVLTGVTGTLCGAFCALSAAVYILLAV